MKAKEKAKFLKAREWKNWRLQQKELKEKGEVLESIRDRPHFEAPIPEYRLMKTWSEIIEPPAQTGERIMYQLRRKRFHSWLKRQHGSTTQKRRNKLASKGIRSRTHIMCLPIWPAAASPSNTAPMELPGMQDGLWLVRWKDALEDLKETRSKPGHKGLQIQLEVTRPVVGTSFCNFPGNPDEQSVSSAHGKNQGVEDDDVSEFDSLKSYSVKSPDWPTPPQKSKERDPSSESEQEMQEVPKVTSVTDAAKEEEQVKQEPTDILREVAGADKDSSGSATLKEGDEQKVIPEMKEEISVIFDTESDGLAMATADHSNNLMLVVDPGATASLLTVKAAEASYSRGQLSEVMPSSRSFRVANDSLMSSSAQCWIDLPGWVKSPAYVIESTDTQRLPVSLSGIPSMVNKVLDMGVSPALVGGTERVPLTRLANGHLALHIE